MPGVRRRLRRSSLAALTVTLVVSGLWAMPAAAKPGSGSPTARDRSVPVGSTGADAKAMANPARFRGKAPVWPSRASAVVDLQVQAGGGRRGQASVGGLPVTVTVGAATDVLSSKALADAEAGRGMPTAVRVEVVDHAAADRAGQAAALRLSRADGSKAAFSAGIEFNYGGFADAFGGDWSHRLGVVTLPACALSTPTVDECRMASRVASTNDAGAQTVSADVFVPAVGETIESAATTLETQAITPMQVAAPAPTGEPLPSASPAPSQAVAPSAPTPVGSPSPSGSAAQADPSSESGVVQAQELSDGSAVVALSAAPSSQAGDFSRTSLSQSGSWQSGGSSGEFSWSYPITTPPVPGGLTPPVSIGYSSAAVDGQTANNNVQPGWIGEGFSFEPGFIERRYRSCAADTTITPVWVDTTDLCWRMANASLSWNGHASELIPDDASDPPNTVMPTSWHLADDDGTKVEYIAGSGSGVTLNWHDERWRVTTKDGTQYWFGLSFVPGTSTRTNSVLGVPVVSNTAGEPCFDAASLANSWCSMAYRWNLDYVVDPHGNSMVYTYAKENNFAHKPGYATAVQGYDRAGYLTKIEYGWRAGQEATAAAPARVLFTTGDRCWTTTCTTHDGSNWPDVPWDLDCPIGGPCKAPTFWLSKRLTQIDTQVSTGGTGYRPVDSYSFDSTVFGTKPGYGGVLNLKSLAHNGVDTGTGVSGPNVNLAPVYFGYGEPMQNRAAFVAGTDIEAWKYRITGITDESGAQTFVNYTAVDSGCTDPADLPDPDHNYRRCYPQLFTPDGGSSAEWTWWHKYVVASVVEHDGTGASATDVTHTYSYANNATVGGKPVGTTDVLWRHDTDTFSTLLSSRTWNQWTGYPVVTEVTGSGSAASQSKTMRLYYTGLEGDRTDAGDGTRHVSLLDTEPDTDGDHRDYPYRAGQLREQITFDGNTATPLNKTLTDSSGIQTGERTLSATWALSYIPRAWIPITTAERDYTWITGSSSWRQTKTAYTYDGYGNQTSLDAQGDVATATDDTCTTTTYLTNPLTNLRRYDGTTATTLATAPVIVNTDWSLFTVPAGDFTGDGKKDLITRTAAGRIYANAGSGTGTFAAGVQISTGFGGFRSLAVADFNGDTKPDIIGNLPDDRLLFYPGNGTGGIGAAIQIGGSGWAPYDLSTPGDLTGDGKPDLVGRRSTDGALYVWPGNGTGSVNTAQLIGSSGWDLYTQVFGGGDYTGDGKPDVLAADGAGVWVYPGSGTAAGTLGTRTRLAAGVIGPDTDWYIPTGDITGDAKPDLLARQLRYLADLESTVHTVGKACGTAVTYPQDAVADARYYYDQPGIASPSLTKTPLFGDQTRTEQAKDYTGSTPNWITTGETSVIDGYGRATTVKDPLGKTTTTAYTQTNGLTTQAIVTNPLSHVTTTTFAAGRGLPVTVTDPNGKVTTGLYDALGRTLKVWQPGHSTGGTPDTEYAYDLSGTNYPPYVTSKTMAPDGSQITSYEILDGLLRTRQTQTPVSGGGRTITDTQYDARGNISKTASFYNAASPGSQVATYTDASVDSQHRFTYDGLSRQLTDELWSRNVQQSDVTSTAYGGDRTTVDNPAGGTDTTTIVDALGRTSELWQYSAGSPSGDHTITKYGYDRGGSLTSVTGPDGSTWTYSYDLLGRKTQTVDPDAGTATSTYDNAGRATSTKDGRNQVLAFTYDDLGRKTGEYDTSVSAANQRAGWVYDTVAKGQLTSSSRYVGGNQTGGSAYTRAVTSYDSGYRPTHTDLTIPAVEGPLAGTYGTDYTYKTNGAPATQTATSKAGTAVGGLPAETYTFGYNSIGQPTSNTGTQTYLANTAYTYDGLLSQRTFGVDPTLVDHSLTYEAATRRLSSAQVLTQNGADRADRSYDQYSYDGAGNIQSISGQTNAATDQVECFDYDYLRRLTDAWTEASQVCNSGTKQKTGADPYRQSWTFDDTTTAGIISTAGLRKSETVYNADGTVAAQSTYTYGGAGKPKHSLATVTTTGAGAGTKTYDYDAAGNTTSRPGPGGAQQTLTWDPEGHLSKVTDSTDTTSVYDADGVRLIRHDPGSYTTLTLTDGTELRANGTGSIAGTRYYGDYATRTANTDASGNPTSGTTLTWTITDHHGTANTAVNATTLQIDRRRSLPYGEPRGPQATGFGTKGFVGGTTDPTGLTHLGAREYDPTTGRFLSVDPIFDQSDPQSWNGYAYSNNSPISFSDPDGLRADDVADGRASQLELMSYTKTKYASVYRAAAKRQAKQLAERRARIEHQRQAAARAAAAAARRRAIAKDAASNTNDARDAASKIATGVAAERLKARDQVRHGTTRSEIDKGIAKGQLVKKYPIIKTIGEWGNKGWIKGAGRATLVAGFFISTAGYMNDGDDGATAAIKGAVETGFGAGVGALAGSAGAVCGPAVVVCGPAFGAAGGYFGGKIGERVNKGLESGSFFGWKPYEATNKWFDWD